MIASSPGAGQRAMELEDRLASAIAQVAANRAHTGELQQRTMDSTSRTVRLIVIVMALTANTAALAVLAWFLTRR